VLTTSGAFGSSTVARRPLGRAGWSVTALGVGGGTLATGASARHTASMLETCWAAGLRYYDTAPLYGNSESQFGDFLMSHERSSYALSTKVGRMPAPAGERRFDFSRSAVEASVAQSLHRLRTDYVDILSIHDLTPAMLGPGFEAARRELLSDAVPYLLDLKRSGVIRFLGIALYDPAAALELLASNAFDCVMIVGAYSLLCHDALSELLPYCCSRGIGVLSASPFHTGLLVTGARAGARFNFQPASPAQLDIVRRIERICGMHDVKLPAAALQFPLLHPAIASVVVGHRTPQEVLTNIAWLGERIPREFWEALKHQGLLPREAPIDAR
jgi:D-threo-aldose 1-dehydrogenase